MNVQIHKQKTVTTTAVAQKQSQEVVQTIVHGGLSSLSYLREFFPEAAYVQRVYGDDGGLPSYEDYNHGKLPAKRRMSSQGINMQLLQRGKSRRVDKLLDWLEFGAFPAIKAGKLQALNVFVHPSATDRSKVIESYTFTVRYVRDAQEGTKAIGIEVGRTGPESTSVGATSTALQQLLLQINALCEGLPQLPSKRFVSMALTYKEDEQVPEGWIPSTTERLLLGNAEGWMRHDEAFDNVFSAFHETSFEISYLQSLSGRKGLAITMPDNFAYTERRPLLGGRASADGHQEKVPVDHGVDTLPDSVATQILTAQVESLEADDAAKDDSIPSRVFDTPAAPSEQTCTQSSNVFEMKEAFRAMMQPERMTQGDTQAQAPFWTQRAESETTASTSRGQRSPSAIHATTVARDPRLALSQRSATRIEQARAKRRTRARTRMKGSKSSSGHTVHCQCGYNDEEGQMIYCDVCDTWQHLHCYGFDGEADPRTPKDHVCYDCLLGQTEPQTMVALSEVIKKRRVLHIIGQEGSTKVSDLAVLMQLPVKVTESIMAQLSKEGYVVTANRGKRHSSGKATYSTVKAGASHDKMLREVFNPLLLIGHHYQRPAAGIKETEDCLDDPSLVQMPPPQTPASRLLASAQTPARGHEDAMSVPRSVTPSDSRHKMSTRSKRSRAESAVDVGVASRAKRVQTEMVLDAGGLPSSPAGYAFT